MVIVFFIRNALKTVVGCCGYELRRTALAAEHCICVCVCACVYIPWKKDELKLMTLLLELRFPGRLITAYHF